MEDVHKSSNDPKIAHYLKEIRRLEQESKGLQCENEILQRSLIQHKNKDSLVKSLEDQIAKLQATHEREKEYWIRDQQDQLARIKSIHEQSQLVLSQKCDSLLRENQTLLTQLDRVSNDCELIDRKFFAFKQAHAKELEKKDEEIKRLNISIEELKSQLSYQATQRDSESLNTKLLLDLEKSKRLIADQQYEIQQQCRLFDELRQELNKKLHHERSKSQISMKAAQELKNEYERRYCQLMEQIIKGSQTQRKSISSVSRSQNQSFRLLPNSSNLHDQTIANDLSRLSQKSSNHIGLSAMNKAANESMDEYDRSFLQSNTKTKANRSEHEIQKQITGNHSASTQQSQQLQLTPLMLGSPRVSRRQSNASAQGNQCLNSSQAPIFSTDPIKLASPKAIEKRRASIRSSKCVKQYTFNLCELNQEGAKLESDCKRAKMPSRQSRQSEKERSRSKLRAQGGEQKQGGKDIEKENQLIVPEENLKINAISSNKQMQMLENKEERLNTNTRFNSLLKIL